MILCSKIYIPLTINSTNIKASNHFYLNYQIDIYLLKRIKFQLDNYYFLLSFFDKKSIITIKYFYIKSSYFNEKV